MKSWPNNRWQNMLKPCSPTRKRAPSSSIMETTFDKWLRMKESKTPLTSRDLYQPIFVHFSVKEKDPSAGQLYLAIPRIFIERMNWLRSYLDRKSTRLNSSHVA